MRIQGCIIVKLEGGRIEIDPDELPWNFSGNIVVSDPAAVAAVLAALGVAPEAD
jgi:hypothetical protein